MASNDGMVEKKEVLREWGLVEKEVWCWEGCVHGKEKERREDLGMGKSSWGATKCFGFRVLYLGGGGGWIEGLLGGLQGSRVANSIS